MDYTTICDARPKSLIANKVIDSANRLVIRVNVSEIDRTMLPYAAEPESIEESSDSLSEAWLSGHIPVSICTDQNIIKLCRVHNIFQFL